MSVPAALLLAFVAWPAGEEDTVVYVTPNGRDTWGGRYEEPTSHSVDGPLATLERAQEVVRSLHAEEREGNVTVRLSAGIYRLPRPLVFGPEDGVLDGVPDDVWVTWEAAPGEQVVLSGARLLGDWNLAEDGTWSHEAPARNPRQLFSQGERLPRARTPDQGWLRVSAPGADGRTSFRYAPGGLTAEHAGAELVFLHDWSMSRIEIERVDEAQATVHLAHDIGARHPFFHITGFEAHPRYGIENVRAAWDRPAEWYVDPTDWRLHYRPRSFEGRDRPALDVPVLESLVEVRGEPGRPVRGLRFVGLEFMYTRAAAPSGGLAGVQAGFYEDRSGPGDPTGDLAPPAAVRATRAVRCAFTRCHFEHLGGTGLWLGEGCREDRVQACAFRDIGANGLMIGEPEEPAADDAQALVSRITCTDNVIEQCGALDFGAVGVWIGIAEHVTVNNNELRELPYTGISLGWIWDPRPSVSRGHRIERNHIHHVMQLLSDGGGIYTLGNQPDTVLADNLIHDVPLNSGRAESNGIFVDEGSTGIVIEGNVIHALARSPIRFHKAGRNVVKQNVLVCAKSVPPFAFHACDPEDEVFEGNVTPDPDTWSAPTPAELEVGPR